MSIDTHTGKNLPSRQTLWTISLVLVVIGLLISGYLSYTKLADTETVCIEDDGFDCDLVNNSKYAEIMGFPITYLGFATYVFIGVLLLLEERLAFLKENGVLTQIHYPIPIYFQEAYQYLGIKEGECPVAEKLAKEILSLPLYPQMEDEKVEKVASLIQKFFA